MANSFVCTFGRIKMITSEQINKYNELREEATRELPLDYLEKICTEANRLAAVNYQEDVLRNMSELKPVNKQAYFTIDRPGREIAGFYSTYKVETILYDKLIYILYGEYQRNRTYIELAIKIVMEEHVKQTNLLKDNLKRYCNSLK